MLVLGSISVGCLGSSATTEQTENQHYCCEVWGLQVAGQSGDVISRWWCYHCGVAQPPEDKLVQHKVAGKIAHAGEK